MITHTESSSETVGEFSLQQSFCSVAVGVPPANLTALPPASPLVVQPVTPGHLSSLADESEQGVLELATAVVMTPSDTTRRQRRSTQVT